jgi:hypothetical protein
MNLKGNGLSFLQFILGLLAACTLLILAAGLFTLAGLNWLALSSAGFTLEDASLFISAGSIVFVALLLVPSILLAFQRLRGKPVTALPERLKPAISLGMLLLLVLVLPASLVIGSLVSSSVPGTAAVLPLMHVFAIGIPLLWLAAIALRGLPTGSLQRAWGVFSAGLVLGPSIIITLEMIAFVVFALAAGFIISRDPASMAQLEALVTALRNTTSSDQLFALITPVITQPGIAVTVLIFMAVVVPLIEETFKPIGLYLLFGRKMTPAEGFTAGLLSGAGFGLFESLMLTSAGDSWLAVVAARAGTGAVHMLTTALTGYGLVSALSERRYLRLAVCYLGAVTLHSVWNALAVIVAGAGLLQTTGDLAQPWQILLVASPLVLTGLAALCFVLLILLNRRLKN